MLYANPLANRDQNLMSGRIFSWVTLQPVFKYLISALASALLNMEALKTASEKYRFCPPGAPWCASFPCQHSVFSTDEDYLAHIDDFVKRRKHWEKVWSLFCNRKNLSPEVLKKYSAKLDRCQRVTDKRRQIHEEIQANTRMFFGLPEEVSLTLELGGLSREERSAELQREFDALQGQDTRDEQELQG